MVAGGETDGSDVLVGRTARRHATVEHSIEVLTLAGGDGDRRV